MVRTNERAVPAERADQAFGDSLTTLKIVWALKYGASSVAILTTFVLQASGEGLDIALDRLATLSSITFLSAIPVVIAALLWLRRRDEPIFGLLFFAAITADALLKITRQGPYFLNHYLLQALIGAIGVMAAGRQLAGHRARDAYRPLLWLALLVWGLAGAKKLVLGSYLNGEYVASTAAHPRRHGLSLLSDTLLSPDGRPLVPERCCEVGDLDVPVLLAVAVVVVGVLFVAGELSPPIFWLLTRNVPAVAWLMLVLSIVAAGLADEVDFGLTNIGLAALWWHGRAFRRTAITTAALAVPIVVWEFVA